MDEAQAQSALAIHARPAPAISAVFQETFLIEMVYAVRRSIAQRVKRELPEMRRRQALLAKGFSDGEGRSPALISNEERRKELSDTVDKYSHARLESLGHRVGSLLVEKLTVDIPKPGAAALASDRSEGLSALNASQLDIVKFVCKDVWIDVFGKQVDGLKTNHRVSLEKGCRCVID